MESCSLCFCTCYWINFSIFKKKILEAKKGGAVSRNKACVWPSQNSRIRATICFYSSIDLHLRQEEMEAADLVRRLSYILWVTITASTSLYKRIPTRSTGIESRENLSGWRHALGLEMRKLDNNPDISKVWYCLHSYFKIIVRKTTIRDETNSWKPIKCGCIFLLPWKQILRFTRAKSQNTWWHGNY